MVSFLLRSGTARRLTTSATAAVARQSAPAPTFPLSSGRKIPTIGWGNGTGDAKKTAVESGAFALTHGIIHIDTAQGYDNEKETGEAFTKAGVSKDGVWVTSKLSTEGGDPKNPPVPVSEVRARTLETIDRLGFSPDLFLVHSPKAVPAGQLIPFWRELEKLKDEGILTGDLGVSNFLPEDITALVKEAKHLPVVNQIEYHPYLLTQLSSLLSTHAEHSIVTAAYGPLSPLLRHKTGGPIKPILERIAEKLSKETGKDVDATSVLLLWTRAMGVVAVTASGKEGNIKKLAQVQYLPDLSKAEVDEISEAGKKVHYRFYDEHMTELPVPDLPSDL
ncbi:conjugated polyketone reductase C1 [Pseudohyphozyma bogoriensis]|nr:conjugated polyketone reductase C1 [Pseudohyphozyma bogoriensis]